MSLMSMGFAQSTSSSARSLVPKLMMICSMKAKATCQEAARQALQAAMQEDEAHTSSLFATKRP